MSFFMRMQSKSSSTKAQFAFVTAGVITGIIAVIWVSTVPSRLREMAPTNIATDDTGNDSFSKIITDSKEQLGNIIESTKKPAEEEDTVSSMDALNMHTVDDSQGFDNGTVGVAPTEQQTHGTTTSETTPVPPEEPIMQNNGDTGTTTPQTTSYESASPQEETRHVILISTTTSQRSEE